MCGAPDLYSRKPAIWACRQGGFHCTVFIQTAFSGVWYELPSAWSLRAEPHRSFLVECLNACHRPPPSFHPPRHDRLMQQLYAPLNFFGTYYRVIQQSMIDMVRPAWRRIDGALGGWRVQGSP